MTAAPNATKTTRSITVENRSSILMQPNGPLTAAIDQTGFGRELVVSGTASSRTAAGERLIEAMVKIVITQADGTIIQSGNDTANVAPDERLEWRILLKPSGMLDEGLIAKIVVQDLFLSTVERTEREMRESAEAERRANKRRAESQR